MWGLYMHGIDLYDTYRSSAIRNLTAPDFDLKVMA